MKGLDMTNNQINEQAQAVGKNEAEQALRIYDAAARFFAAEFEGIRNAKYWETYFTLGLIYRMGVLEGKRQGGRA